MNERKEFISNNSIANWLSLLIQWEGWYTMSMYCSVCGDELEPEEEMEGICESCKLAASGQISTDEVEP